MLFLIIYVFLFLFLFLLSASDVHRSPRARAIQQKSNSIEIGNSYSGDSSIRVSSSGIGTERFSGKLYA